MPSHVATKTVATNTAASKTSPDLRDRPCRSAEGDERPGVCPRPRRGNAAAEHDRPDLGYDVAEAANGQVVVTAEPNDSRLNPAGTVHGGMAATLLDGCMGLAII